MPELSRFLGIVIGMFSKRGTSAATWCGSGFVTASAARLISPLRYVVRCSNFSEASRFFGRSRFIQSSTRWCGQRERTLLRNSYTTT